MHYRTCRAKDSWKILSGWVAVDMELSVIGFCGTAVAAFPKETGLAIFCCQQGSQRQARNKPWQAGQGRARHTDKKDSFLSPRWIGGRLYTRKYCVNRINLSFQESMVVAPLPTFGTYTKYTLDHAMRPFIVAVSCSEGSAWHWLACPILRGPAFASLRPLNL